MLENGYAMFDEQHKGTGDIVPVDCVEGYNIVGGHSTTCLADGSWSKAVNCRIKGLLFFRNSLYLYDIKCLLVLVSFNLLTFT